MSASDVGVFGSAGATLRLLMSSTQQVSAFLRQGDLASIRVGVEPWEERGGEEEGRRVAYECTRAKERREEGLWQGYWPIGGLRRR